jgi:hypothetical protein
MKQQIQLSLDAEVIRQLRKKDINISALVNNLLWNVVRQEAVHAEEIALTLLQNDRQRLVESLKRIEESAERTKQFIAEVDEKIEKQKAVIQEVRKSERIATLMRELNEQIVNANYDFESVKESETLKKLVTFGIPISEAWLKRHIARIELLGK